MTLDKSTVIRSKNLRLRIPSKVDFPHIFSATRFDGFNDGMPWNPPESEEDLIDPLLRTIKAWEDGEGFSFTIEEEKTGDFLGRISIRKTAEKDRWNIGFWTHPRHQGRGIMTEAVGAMIKIGFEKLDANTIEACHALWNKGSEKVLKKNGMKFEKFLEKGFLKNGKWVEENMLSIDYNSWKSKNE